ncbi:MAG: hypothetical protein HFI42_01455 [Lachnospiraceae bacterium]|nr:hypothetical protein [Lachnospiraceae bacterium]MCI9149153.1 hypothetical protein [Lachnospiraceae bacterium]
MTGKLAISRAGHDRDTIYVITGEDASSVYLADGRIRTVEKPKRKNKKHIQIIQELPQETAQLLSQDRAPGNEEIKRAIKLYNRR